MISYYIQLVQLIHHLTTIDPFLYGCLWLVSTIFSRPLSKVEAGSILRGSATHWRLGRPVPWRSSLGVQWGFDGIKKAEFQ